jgi:hypothetical protein
MVSFGIDQRYTGIEAGRFNEGFSTVCWLVMTAPLFISEPVEQSLAP